MPLARESGANTMTSEQRIIFSEIYIDNRPKMLRYAKMNKLCAPVAEELVHDTFHDAWSRFGNLINHENIGGWLMQTLKNKMRNYARAKRREANLLVDYGDRSEDIAASGNFINALIVSDALSAIYRFVYDNFKEDDITMFRRIFIENVSHAEVAAELGITVWSSQKRLERIRKRIREEFPNF